MAVRVDHTECISLVVIRTVIHAGIHTDFDADYVSHCQSVRFFEISQEIEFLITLVVLPSYLA